MPSILPPGRRPAPTLRPVPRPAARSRRATQPRRHAGRLRPIRRPPAAPPPGSLAVAPPTAAPVAITGDFVPDEVLVTVDGDACRGSRHRRRLRAGSPLAAHLDAARLDRRALRHPRRPPGRRRARPACRRRQDDGARAQPHLRPAAGGGRRELRLPAHRTPARRCQRREREDRRHRHRASTRRIRR